MTLTIPEDVRAKAEIYLGDAAGQEKTRFMLQETGLPSGLLPLRDIVECGYVEETGFVWLRQRRKVDHYFAKAGRHVTYGAEVSAYAEAGRLKKITGVKAKEMLIWVALHEICLDEANPGKLVCKALGGLSRSFPVEAFQAPDTAGVNKPAAAAVPVVAGDKAVAPAATDRGLANNKEQEAKMKKPEEAAALAVAVNKENNAAAAAEGDDDKKEDTVDKVEEKLKEMTTTDQQAVQAGAVAAKN